MRRCDSVAGSVPAVPSSPQLMLRSKPLMCRGSTQKGTTYGRGSGHVADEGYVKAGGFDQDSTNEEKL